LKNLSCTPPERIVYNICSRQCCILR
jgi:hypothetical protein